MAGIPDQLDSLKILHYPSPALREPGRPIANPADPKVARLAGRMIELMHQADGVGLAATQLGVAVRMFVANPERDTGHELVVINPEVVQTEGWQETKEGCLSLPEVSLKLRRRNRVVLRYQDLSGQARQVEAIGFLASIFQHEGDHLDGKLIIDRAGLIGRMAIRDGLKRLEEEFEAEQAAVKT